MKELIRTIIQAIPCLLMFACSFANASDEVPGMLNNTPEHSVQLVTGVAQGGSYIEIILRSTKPLTERGLYLYDRIPGFKPDAGIFYLFTMSQIQDQSAKKISAWRVRETHESGMFERVYQIDLKDVFGDTELKIFIKDQIGLTIRFLTSIQINKNESGFEDYVFKAVDFMRFSTDRCEKMILEDHPKIQN